MTSTILGGRICVHITRISVFLRPICPSGPQSLMKALIGAWSSTVILKSRGPPHERR